jgi:hypothetical protein
LKCSNQALVLFDFFRIGFFSHVKFGMMIILLVNMISYTLWVVHRRCIRISIDLRYNCSKFWLPTYECAIGVTIETTSKMVLLTEFVYKVYQDTYNHTIQDYYGMQVVDYLKLSSYGSSIRTASPSSLHIRLNSTDCASSRLT